MSDLLEQATRALRETSDRPEPRSGLTRGRMLDAAERRYGQRRSPFVRWAIALAAVFAASTALARVAEYWPEIRRALAPESGEPSERRAPRHGKGRTTSPRSAEQQQPSVAPAERDDSVAPAERDDSAAPAERDDSVAPAERDTSAAPAERAPPVRVRARADRSRRSTGRAGERGPARAFDPAPSASTSSAVTESTKPAADSAELALFRRAQRLHLERDPGALAAWDAYLRVAGDGVLAPEARYNRALCLVRLGRTREAREALEAFARGVHGGFRQREAEALLQELAR